MSFVNGFKANANLTTTENGALVHTTTGNAVAIDFDESIVFVFDCGGAN